MSNIEMVYINFPSVCIESGNNVDGLVNAD